jgi:hypothetical protein
MPRIAMDQELILNLTSKYAATAAAVDRLFKAAVSSASGRHAPNATVTARLLSSTVAPAREPVRLP